jgi:hypothetical protein
LCQQAGKKLKCECAWRALSAQRLCVAIERLDSL